MTREVHVLCLAEFLKLELSVGICQFWNEYAIMPRAYVHRMLYDTEASQL